MPSLAEAQANFIATINDGPNRLDASIFAGDTGRILLGLKAHANTISHSRLIALEETFPRCREAMGDAAFNAASRNYCETKIGRERDNNTLGEKFTDFLVEHDAAPDVCDLAAIEWLWLKSYHAAEARPLALSDLAQLDEAALLATPVDRHPAAFIIKLNAAISNALPELDEYRDAHALLISRPTAEVRLTPMSALEHQLLSLTGGLHEKKCFIRNLLELSAEQEDEDDALTPIIKLINAGGMTSSQQA